MITIDKSNEKIKNYVSIDTSNNVLVIGTANSSINQNKIMKHNNNSIVSKTYGDCRLSRSFCILNNLGVNDIFILNVKPPYETDFIGELITQYNFAYIVFTDIYFSTSFSTKNKNDMNISFAGALMERCKNNVTSTFIFTDKHASLYEDLDSYLDDMIAAHDFILHRNYGYDKRNLIFVLNNLKNYELSNVVLAGVLASSSVGIYPDYDFGEAIFDIINNDIHNKEIAYFKNNSLRNTTVENLLNYYDSGSPLKIVFIDRIVKYVKRAIDLSKYKGKLYTPHQKDVIKDEVIKILDTMVPNILLKYELIKITEEFNIDNTVDLTVYLNIWPIGCLEKITVIVD